jgi:hypothetical protein
VGGVTKNACSIVANTAAASRALEEPGQFALLNRPRRCLRSATGYYFEHVAPLNSATNSAVTNVNDLNVRYMEAGDDQVQPKDQLDRAMVIFLEQN